MAKKKSRPAFNLPSTDKSRTAASPEWVYRSDAEADAAAAEPARRARRVRARPAPEASSSAPASEPESPPARAAAGPTVALATTGPRAIARPALVPASPRMDGAKEIVGNYVMLAAGAGLVPVPAIDVLAIGGLQLKMISALSDHYQVPFSQDRGKAALFSLVGGIFSTRMAYGIGGSLLKIIPVIGPAVSAFAMPGFGAAFTWAVGAVFVQHFESGGTLLSFDGAKMRASLDHEMDRGAATVA